MNIIIVAVEHDNLTTDFEVSIIELKALCEACNFTVVDELFQKTTKINSSTFLNSGKLLELAELQETVNADAIVFSEELSSRQLRSIKEVIFVPIYDRTLLILEIFASRAKSREAILQVKIAQERYNLSHLIGERADIYSQQGGSGFRGAGETQLEIDRRHGRHTIDLLKQQLEEITKNRQTQRRKRHKQQLKQVCLVGYTNSGKSSLMNQLVTDEKQVFVKDMLFATLETNSRRIDYKNKAFVITDTVGFIDQLPTSLIQAFHSTLEEIKEADLLLHIIDSSNIHYQQQINTTKQVLKELDADHIPVLYVYNKIDLNNGEGFFKEHPFITISCKNNINIDKLLTTIVDTLFKQQRVSLHIPYHAYKLLQSLKENEEIITFEEDETGANIIAFINEENLSTYQEYIHETA